MDLIRAKSQFMKICISTISTLVGFISGVILIYLIESIAFIIHPLPSHLKSADARDMAIHLSNAPPMALLVVVIAYAAGAFAGGAVAQVISKNTRCIDSIATGILLMATAAINFISIQHPLWMMIVGLAVFVPMSLKGGKVVKGAINSD